MNRHESYQETDFEWIGTIPKHWGLSRAGKFFSERSNKVDDITYPPLSVTMSGVVDQLADVAKTNDSDNRKLVQKGDFVINSRSDRKGSSGISPRDGSVSLINIVLNPRDIDPKFIQHLFKSYYFKEEYFRHGKGICWDLWTTRWDQFKNINIPVPSLKEQKRISGYLGMKAGQIDVVIEKMQKKIELLKETRISLISQCVTKGLDPNVKMKNSDVEWIGEMPANWDAIRSRFMFNNKSEKNFLNEPLLSVTQRDGVVIRSEFDMRVWNPTADVSGYKLIDPGDFVISLRSFEGGIELSKVRGIVSPAYTILETYKDIDHHYFWWLMKSHQFIIELNRHVTGIRQGKNIIWDDFSNIHLTIPSMGEQKRISSHLDKKARQIDRLIEKIEKKISLLSEYRQSLISSVVTGKIKVTEEMI